MISPADPCAAWTAKANKRVQFGYGLNYLIDIADAIIVDVEATPARTCDEVAAATAMIERTGQTLGLKPGRLAAGTAYGTGKFLGWLAGTGITPQIPVWDKSKREDGTFSRSDFTFERERNLYICPAGKLLATTAVPATATRCATLRPSSIATHVRSSRGAVQIRPRARSRATSTRMPAIMPARSWGRRSSTNRATNASKKVEMRFAQLKTHHRFERLRLGGLSGPRDEFHLAAIVPNLKTLANHIWRQPPGTPTACLA